MLSIIIPTLNEEDYLPTLLNSIKDQDFTDYELIVADAGSKDKTLEIAKSFNCRIVPGGLPSKGRNEGAKAARGDLLLFLDADVILTEHFLRNAVEKFKKDDLGIAGFLILIKNGRKIDDFLYYIFDKWLSLTGKIFHYSAVAIMSKREVHEAIKGFNEAVTFEEDLFYTIQAAKIAKYEYIKQPFYTTTRRYEKDGRITYLKYVLAAIYIYFTGHPVKSGMFNYKFNHYNDERGRKTKV